MKYPHGQRGKVYAVLILLIPVLLLVKHIVAPAWSSYAEIGSDIDDARFELERYQRIAANLPDLQKHQRALAKLKPLSPFLLTGKNRSLAAANMQRRLQSLVKQNSGRILSTRVLKHQQDDAFELISLNARFQLPIAGLQKVLHTLETGTPYVFIDQLNITAKNVRRGSNPDELDVRLTMHSMRSPDQGGKSG